MITNCAFDETFDQVTKRCVKKCSDSFQIFNAVTLSCECIVGYHSDPFSGKCVVNPIQCGQNQIYSPNDNKCICFDGYIFDSQGNCVPMCDATLYKVYDPSRRSCICQPGYILNNDQSCVLASSFCLSINHQHYDDYRKSCVCDTGYIMNLNDGKCYE